MRSSVLIIILSAVVVLLALGVTGVRALEQQPSFCARCHEERINYETWLSSGAAKHHPTCIECHSGPGLTGVINAQMRGVVHVVKHVTGQYTEPLRGTVPRAWCTQCHVEDAKLQKEHHEVSDFAVRACSECHNHRPGVRFKGEEEEERGREKGEREEGERD